MFLFSIQAVNCCPMTQESYSASEMTMGASAHISNMPCYDAGGVGAKP